MILKPPVFEKLELLDWQTKGLAPEDPETDTPFVVYWLLNAGFDNISGRYTFIQIYLSHVCLYLNTCDTNYVLRPNDFFWLLAAYIPRSPPGFKITQIQLSVSPQVLVYEICQQEFRSIQHNDHTSPASPLAAICQVWHLSRRRLLIFARFSSENEVVNVLRAAVLY